MRRPAIPGRPDPQRWTNLGRLSRRPWRRGSASPVHVTREGPDALSRYCLVHASGAGGIAKAFLVRRAAMDITEDTTGPFVIGGVDTHKDLPLAAVGDNHDRLLGSQSFATTRHGYKQMLAWMRSFGPVRRVGVEATGTYGAGLRRYLQKAGVEVLEVTTPDKGDRRKRGKNDDIDA